MKKAKNSYHLWLRQLLLAGLFWSLCMSCVHAGMGMDFGDGDEDLSCVPDTNLVIVPGPLGSPVRISFYGKNKILIADYTKFAIKKVVKDQIDEPLFFFDSRLKSHNKNKPQGVKGKPLSVVARSVKGGKILYVGNDDRKTLDVYRKNRDGVVLTERFFRESGVQALDIELDETSSMIFLVDGLKKRIKVIDYFGKRVRNFGGDGRLSDPKGLALNRARKEVVVTDYGDPAIGLPASIQIFGLRGKHKKTITGGFSRPQGVDVAGNKIFVADAMLGQILEFDRESGEMVSTHGCFGVSEGHLLLPMDVVVDEVMQILYVADNRNGRITELPLITEP